MKKKVKEEIINQNKRTTIHLTSLKYYCFFFTSITRN